MMMKDRQLRDDRRRRLPVSSYKLPRGPWLMEAKKNPMKVPLKSGHLFVGLSSTVNPVNPG